MPATEPSALSAPPPPNPLDLVERRASAGWFGNAEARWLTCWLERLAPHTLTPVPSRLLHADTQDSNVLVRPVRSRGGDKSGDDTAYAAVLDWGCAHWGDAALDLACGPLRAAPYLLAGHREVAPLDADDTVEARVLWHSVRVTLELLPRGAAPGWAWAERPVARLVDTLRFFLEAPPPPWPELAPDRCESIAVSALGGDR